ncbi:MAG TPA: NADH-quinone oxidoreductase subunit D [bacterium]|jgi:NADH-quinone oxidoreductase subunit D
MSYTLSPVNVEDPNVETDDFFLNMGPQHPSTHGVLRVLLHMNGERVKKATPYFGYLHRCSEKKSEEVKYPVVIPYTDRWDYLSAMANNHVYCMAVEKLMEVEVPRRAEIIRVVTVELQRLASHLFWLGTFANDLGSTTMLMYCTREREKIIDIFEMQCGSRLTYHYIRIGGVMRDWDDRMQSATRALMKEMPNRIHDYEDLFTGNEIFRMRVIDVGYLSPDDAVAWSCSGPYLRGSGIPYDLRRTEPYSIYPELEFDVQVSDKCDLLGRYDVRVGEMYESVRIINQCLDLLEDSEPGDFMAQLPATIKPKAGETYAAVESPRGELGVYLVSDGSDKPWRVHCRAPSFVNLTSLDYVGRGGLIADFVAILGGIDIVLGEVDR